MKSWPEKEGFQLTWKGKRDIFILTWSFYYCGHGLMLKDLRGTERSDEVEEEVLCAGMQGKRGWDVDLGGTKCAERGWGRQMDVGGLWGDLSARMRSGSWSGKLSVQFP